MLELPPNCPIRATTMTKQRGRNWRRSARLNGPYCPHCGSFRYREANPDSVQGERRRLVLVHAVPPEIHCARRLHLSSQPRSLAQVAYRLSPSDRIEKGFLRASATSHPERQLQDRMVYRAPHPRVHG